MSILIHSGLKTWTRVDYVEGLRARFAELPMAETAPHSYQCGWEDADLELRETTRHNRVIERGTGDDFGEAWGALFDAGGDARTHGIAFDGERTAPWKEGWIDADINMGVMG